MNRMVCTIRTVGTIRECLSRTVRTVQIVSEYFTIFTIRIHLTVLDNHHHISRNNKDRFSGIKQLLKHQTPCSFLKKGGHCFNGRSCEFLHQNSHATNFPWSWDNTSYPYMPRANRYPFQVSTAHFPSFQPPQYHPIFRPFSYPLPLVSIPTRLPVF